MSAKRTLRSGSGYPERKNSYATPALEKGLDVIELLARQPRGLTRSEISRELNRTVSEIFRMLLCLEQRGYIAKVNGDRCALTPKLFKLVQETSPDGTAHHRSASCDAAGRLQHTAVMPHGRYRRRTGDHSCAGKCANQYWLYVRLGSSVELLEATTGHVILAHQDEEHRARTLAEWKRLTGSEVPSDLHAQLDRVKRQGFESTQLPGPWCDQH